ncbi:MAG TPA: hypothetical protein VD788_00295 [Candidatus Polarisedimenticolaceae bacterium]|nr:hypothetical protein [Candidatus Polarisedimenticolaceae bacterium]
MLARYKIYRGARPADDPAPHGTRQDTREHTRHPLRPDAEQVARFLDDPDDPHWRIFRRAYLALLEDRFAADRAPFDALAREATEGDVFIGCNCPTRNNPDVGRCHTVLALGFMRAKYPRLRVRCPDDRRR